MSKVVHQEPIAEIWLEDKTIKEFLDAQLNKNTKATYTTYMKRLLEFTEYKESGAEILKQHKQWERRIFVYYNWLKDKTYSQNYCESCTGCLRGFFSHFRKPLNLTPKERIKLSMRNRTTEDYYFDNTDLFKCYLSGTLKGKYALAVGKSIGLRSEDFGKLTYGRFRALKLDSEPPIFLGAIPTSKEGVKAYCFLDADAVQAVRDILEANKDKLDSDKVWSGNDDYLSGILRRMAKRAKIDSHGAKIHFHCLRKFLCDRLSSHMGESKWKQIVGKKISESAYISPNLLRDDFMRAMPNLNILNGNGETKKKLTTLENEVVQLKAENSKLREQKEEDKRTIETLQTKQNSMNKSIGELNDFRDIVEKKLNIKQKVSID